MKRVLIGIDWGGTFLKLGIFNLRGKLLNKYKLSSGDFSKPSKFFKSLKKVIEAILRSKKLDLSKVEGVGVGAPGIINTEEGFIYYLPNIKGWRNFPFKAVFEEEFGLPLALDNDANLAALAELKRGQAKGVRNAVLFTLGTGLGSGLILNGRVFRGGTSSSEAAHFPMSFRGRKCSCGSRGCIETFLGSKYIVKEAKKFFGNRVASPKDLYQLALQGQRKALKVWENFGYRLGVFSAGLINLLDLELIVLSGGVSKAFRFFREGMKRAIRERALFPFLKKVKIKVSKLKEEAGIIGAYEFIKAETND